MCVCGGGGEGQSLMKEYNVVTVGGKAVVGCCSVCYCDTVAP